MLNPALGHEMDRFFKRHLPKPQVKIALLAGLGAALAISLLALASDMSKVTILIAPFAATCALLFAAPTAPMSQPINVVGGHVLSAAIGIAVANFMPLSLFSGALAVGLAVAAMMALRITHPPAGATALSTAMISAWSFLLFPILIGSLALVAIASAYHRLVGNSYPLK
jgi:CBS-domain-containing membrane protein